MNDNSIDTALRVPERTIPVPAHLSAPAQAALSMRRGRDASGYPDLNDKAAWQALVTVSDSAIGDYVRSMQTAMPCESRERRCGEALAYEIVPDGVTAADRRVYLDIHGGALIMGGGELCRAMGQVTAVRLGVRVLAADYRMPPGHPYPAALDDCMAYYRALLEEHDPSDIIVGGNSAGGNLTAALVLRARDEGLPLPAAAVLRSPEIDLTETGDSFNTNIGIDAMGRLMKINLLYADGADLAHPYLSPLFGDFAKGFPPTIVTTGTRDLFLSNSVRMHRALRAVGIPAELHVLEAGPHSGFGGNSPEEAEIDREVRAFCERWWGNR
jgi:monoterpene epsilon-lactone hydrolase